MSTSNSTINPSGVDWWYVPSTTTGITSDGINIYDPFLYPNTAPYPISNFGDSVLTYSNINLKPTQQLAKENFDLIVNYNDINKEGIFKVGSLYKFDKKGIEYFINNQNNILPLSYIVSLKREFSTKNSIYNDELLLNCSEEDKTNSELFLCLDSKLEERDDLLAVSKDGKIKIINKSWITRFLVDEKVYQFKWFENPLYADCGNEQYQTINKSNGGNYYVIGFPGHNFFNEI